MTLKLLNPVSKSPYEEKILELIAKELPPFSSEVLSGIGDDCAVIKNHLKKDFYSLLKTDALVEGIHYSPGTPLAQVGWKALARPASDIAAMGGSPDHALITVAAPASWESTAWRTLYRGLGKAARSFHISIVGGETVRSSGALFLSVTLTGSVQKKSLRLRSGGSPGDLICVTGKLGGSFKSGRHLRFTPRLAEGLWLGQQPGVSAMMDLSDGLGSDLPKLAAASGTSFHIDPSSLPRHRGVPIEEAVSDGEDYELLCCIHPAEWNHVHQNWNKYFATLPLTCIGKLISSDFSSTPLASGYDHFNP